MSRSKNSGSHQYDRGGMIEDDYARGRSRSPSVDSRSRSSGSPGPSYKRLSGRNSATPPHRNFSGKRASSSRSRSRTRSPSRTRYRDRRRRSVSRSRSRSRSHSRSRRGRYRGSERSRSPFADRKRYGNKPHAHAQFNPNPSRVIGVFGLSLYTGEKDLKDIFDKYGPIDRVQVVYDHQTGRSRGFAFIYFSDVEDAIDAKERCNGLELDGRKIRVDYSITKRPHTPTPGVYMGRPTRNDSRERDRSPRYRDKSPRYSDRSPRHNDKSPRYSDDHERGRGSRY